MDWGTVILTIVTSILASSGVWAVVAKVLDGRSAKTQMLIGLGHDRICFLGLKYIERGYIYTDEYENLHDYLYKPYAMMGGNGSAKLIMDQVSRLEVRKRETK
jgi:hypothetical protein